MAAIVDISDAKEGPGLDVEVEWVRFDKNETTWEALSKIWHASPQFVKSAAQAGAKKRQWVRRKRTVLFFDVFCLACQRVAVWSNKGHLMSFNGSLVGTTFLSAIVLCRTRVVP